MTEPEVATTRLTLREELEAGRRKIREDREPLLIQLPGFSGKMAARYKCLPYEQLRAINRRTQKMAELQDDRAEIKGICDLLMKACLGLFWREGDEMVPLEDHLGSDEGPVTYNDRRLREELGLDASTEGREVVRAVFGDDDTLLTFHASKVDRWMSAANQQDEQDF